MFLKQMREDFPEAGEGAERNSEQNLDFLGEVEMHDFMAIACMLSYIHG